MSYDAAHCERHQSCLHENSLDSSYQLSASKDIDLIGGMSRLICLCWVQRQQSTNPFCHATQNVIHWESV